MTLALLAVNLSDPPVQTLVKPSEFLGRATRSPTFSGEGKG